MEYQLVVLFGVSGQSFGATISYGGFTVGGYTNESKADGGTAGKTDGDKTDHTAYIKYTAGPVSIGYQEGYIEKGITGAATAAASPKTVAASNGHFDIEAMGLAFNVNENFSISPTAIIYCPVLDSLKTLM